MTIATIGITRLLTNELTRAPNATPSTNATASSTMFPRSRKSLNSLSITSPFFRGPVGGGIRTGNPDDYNPVRAGRGPDRDRDALPRGQVGRRGLLPRTVRLPARQRLGRDRRHGDDGRGPDA